MMLLGKKLDLIHLEKVGPNPAPPPHADELLGIITEDGSAFITTEDGKVLRTEDQPQFP